MGTTNRAANRLDHRDGLVPTMTTENVTDPSIYDSTMFNENVTDPSTYVNEWCHSGNLSNPIIDLSFVECKSRRWNECRTQNVHQKLNTETFNTDNSSFKLVLPVLPGILICNVTSDRGTESFEMLLHNTDVVESEMKMNIGIDIIAVGFLVFLTVALATLVYFCRDLWMKKCFTKGSNVEQEENIMMNVHFFRREKMQLVEQLSHGQFGVYWKAIVTGVGEDPFLDVEVMAKEASDTHGMEMLQKEIMLYRRVGRHMHLSNLLGAVIDDVEHGEIFLITEYGRFGNLKLFLQRNRSSFLPDVDVELFGPNSMAVGESAPPYIISFSKVDLLYWAYQIACGMQYLVTRDLIHGELAAINVLLGEKSIIKLTHFGISQLDEENSKAGKTRLPLEWMALESIQNGTFTTSSDVWSYGVLLWELFSLGCDPYPDSETHETLAQKLQEGYRLSIPMYASEEIFQIMCSCWERDPTGRPNFQMLQNKIKPLLPANVLTNYEEFKKIDG